MWNLQILQHLGQILTIDPIAYDNYMVRNGVFLLLPAKTLLPRVHEWGRIASTLEASGSAILMHRGVNPMVAMEAARNNW